MKRVIVTFVTLALLSLAAVLVGRKLMTPAAETKERSKAVLTGLHEPKLVDCRVMEDSELPDGLERPAVGEDWHYLRVEILYPAAAKAPEPREHFLDAINGGEGLVRPAHFEADLVDEDGAYVVLLFKVDTTFLYAELRRGEAVVVARVAPR